MAHTEQFMAENDNISTVFDVFDFVAVGFLQPKYNLPALQSQTTLPVES